MLKAVHIDLPTDNRGHLLHSVRVPATARYRLVLAEVNYWQSDGFSLLEQYYDAPDAFICLVDVDTEIPLEVAISCELSDLYWLYQLHGDYRIHLTDETRKILLQTAEASYTQVYVPEGRYIARFDKGKHRLFYFVIKPNWLLRHGKKEWPGFQKLLDNWKEKAISVRQNKQLPISGPIILQLLNFFALPTIKRLAMDLKVYELCFNLLSLSQEDMQSAVTKSTYGYEKVEAIRRAIEQQIQHGQIQTIKQLANHYSISESWLRKIHTEIYGHSLGQYLKQTKLRQAAILLDDIHYSISEIAYLLGYSSLASFTNAFRTFYGITPSAYRSKQA
ncbi:MAG: helix-turn-helix transcriptional regulator [Olivibacter sp.]|nr:helix-turn-helix transcriptional regulator [Olivibacter sp. UJ_SKK_5.1]